MTEYKGEVTVTKVYVNELHFVTREEIYLFGFYLDNGKWHDTQYVIERKELQLLLSTSVTGQEILWRIEELFVSAHTVPAQINLIDLFGATQMFEAKKIEMDAPFFEDETGELKVCEEHELFFIENVII